MAQETASKKLKTSPPLIGTHKFDLCLHPSSKSTDSQNSSGHFHADEALAVYLLRLLPTYSASPLLRSRDPTALSTCHTVVDVGGEYDPGAHRYDHHQRTFDTTFPNHATKLSSAGLIYLHFGKAIIAHRTSLSETNPTVSLLHSKLYTDFIEALDADDNGIAAYPPSDTAGLHKRFNDKGVTLGSLVSDLNHAWDPNTPPPLPSSSPSKKPSLSPEQAQAEEDARFLQASQLMGTTFLRKLHHYHSSWLPARTVVHTAYKNRFACDSSGAIMAFDKGSVPWKDHLYTLEAEQSSSPDTPKVLYVLYPEGGNESAKWRVQCVSVTKESFESRRPLREEWRGLRGEELSGKSGIEGVCFCACQRVHWGE